jgi:outer membrane protein OmpA-like peptidoglycan-associated protein
MNLMKIATYLLGALLAAALGAAALFYFTTFQPMAIDYARLKAGMPELDRAKAELKKYKEKEAQQAKEVAWINPAVEALSTGLADEIKAGRAEVVSAGNTVVINIAEDALYTPGSKTFAKDTQTLLKLASLLKKDELKGKDIFLGNAAEAVAAHGKGKKKVPAKDALTLASERSTELEKYLVKNGVPQESLAALAYSAKLPDRGFKIKNRKTMIIISTCPASPSHDSASKPEASPAAQPKPAQPAAGTPPQTQPKTIPIRPAQPKTN